MKLVKKKVSKKDKITNLKHKQKSTGGVIGRVYDSKKNQYNFVKNEIPYQPNAGFVIDNKWKTRDKSSSKILDTSITSPLKDIEEDTPASIDEDRDIDERNSDDDKYIIESVAPSMTLPKLIALRRDYFAHFFENVQKIYNDISEFHKDKSCIYTTLYFKRLKDNKKNLEQNLENTIKLMTVNGGGFFKNPFKNIFKGNKEENPDKRVDIDKYKKKLREFWFQMKKLEKDTDLFYSKLMSDTDDPYFERDLNNINNSLKNILPELQKFRIDLLHYTARNYLLSISLKGYNKQLELMQNCFSGQYTQELIESNFSRKNFAGWAPGRITKYFNQERIYDEYYDGPLGGDSSSSKNDCPDGKIENPITKRCITINGKIYKDLVKQGVLQPIEQQNKESSNQQKRDCKEDEQINPLTKRCLKIGSYLWKKLVKEGIIKVNDAEKSNSNKKSSSRDKSIGKNKKQCNNHSTFLMFEDIDNVKEDDLIKTQNGYCFSATELMDFINSNEFKNINPHNPQLELLTEKEIDVVLKNHPKLLDKIRKYFQDKMKQQDDKKKIFEQTIDILYAVGNTGRICYFNNLFSTEENDSSVFQRSIQSLQELSEKIETLPQKQKSAYDYVISLIESSNNGEMCIHGTGLRFISFFIRSFNITDVKYNPNETGLYFTKVDDSILFYSNEHRFTFTAKQLKMIFGMNLGNFYDLVQNVKKDMITKQMEKSELYDNVCEYDSFMVTEDALDKWQELPDWRKIRFNQKYCFDIFYLIKIMTDNLNNTKNNNPYPKFPTNPFTQKPFEIQEIEHLYFLTKDNFLDMNPPLNIFFKNSELWKNTRNWSEKFIEKMEKEKRFVRLLNFVGNELHCHGMWHNKNRPMSSSEKKIIEFLNGLRSIQSLRELPTETVPEKYYYRMKHFVANDTIFEV